jgi:hypothetical protein
MLLQWLLLFVGNSQQDETQIKRREYEMCNDYGECIKECKKLSKEWIAKSMGQLSLEDEFMSNKELDFFLSS